MQFMKPNRSWSVISTLFRKSYKTKKSSNYQMQKDEEVIHVQGEILYGVYSVKMALKAKKRELHTIYYNPGSRRAGPIVEFAMSRGVLVKPASFESLNKLSWRSEKTNGVHGGICADVSKMFQKDINDHMEEEEDDKPKLWVLLCGLSDPMNLGAVIRSAYFLGADVVLTSADYPSAPLTPVVSKASAGAMEVFPPKAVYQDIFDFLQNKRDVDGWNIVGTRVKKSKDGESGIETPKLDRSTILLIGTEGSGIPREILRLCNKFLHLPSGRALDEDMDSLNVSVASALLIHSLKQTEISINVKSD